jgi:hypothetical protein
VSDLLTESVLPVLGLCPPGSLLLPWLSQARTAGGRPLGLPAKGCAATFAVAKRVAQRRRSGALDAPVAVVLLEPEGGPAAAEATLVMLDWVKELGPHSSAALKGADPKQIFGMDVRIGRRYLMALTEDDALPQALLRGLSPRLQMPQGDLGWVGLHQLLDVISDYLRRLPRDRWRAPERTAADLLARLAQVGVCAWHPLMTAPTALLTGDLPHLDRRYEPRVPGSREFPWSFGVRDSVYNEAMVLDAQLERRRQLRSAAIGSKK